MSSSTLALAFPQPAQPLVLAAARDLALCLARGEALSRPTVNHVLGRHFGGSDADGRWSVRDAHAALELAQVLWLQADAGMSLDCSNEVAEVMFARLEALVPAQVNRSDEQIELQQFATPPRIAWLAARAAAVSPGDLLLEPSAGTGMLALWAQKARARLVLNEISPLRRACLVEIFPAAVVTGHDGELIDELLAPHHAPGVVLMNPPYSHGLERGHDGATGARHLRSAWRRLTPGRPARRDNARMVRRGPVPWPADRCGEPSAERQGGTWFR